MTLRSQRRIRLKQQEQAREELDLSRVSHTLISTNNLATVQKLKMKRIRKCLRDTLLKMRRLGLRPKEVLHLQSTLFAPPPP